MFKKIKNKLLKSNNNDIDGSIIEVIKNLARKPIKTVFDIGAHHGRYSTSILNIINDVDIYMFEPFPRSFKTLIQNSLLQKQKIYNIAMSNYTGESLFYVNSADETNSLLPSIQTNSYIDALTKNEEIIHVDVITLDSFCTDNNVINIDLLKIDVQGNTLNVLKGASNLLNNGQIELIQCEVEFLTIYKDQSLFHHVSSFLENYDYSFYSMYNIHYDINNRASWADILYYKNK